MKNGLSLGVGSGLRGHGSRRLLLETDGEGERETVGEGRGPRSDSTTTKSQR
jgi:hypothetical protein